MNMLKEICSTYGKWKPLEECILRIETYRESNGAVVLENCKALVDTICKTILVDLGESLTNNEKTHILVSKACNKMGCLPNTGDLARSFITVAQRLGEFRNNFSVISHGASVYQIEERRNKITRAATDFMISTVAQLSFFLITVYHEEFPILTQRTIRYEDNPEFNEKYDEETEPVQIGGYGPYPPSEVLFNIDMDAYKTELSNYTAD